MALLILRWIGAVVLAFHVYLLALGFGVFITRTLGMNADLAIAFATMAAALAGAMVVPRDQRRKAALAIWLLALLYPLWVFLRAASSGGLSAGGLSALLYSLSGGTLAYYLLKGGFAGRSDSRDAPGHRVTL